MYKFAAVLLLSLALPASATENQSSNDEAAESASLFETLFIRSFDCDQYPLCDGSDSSDEKAQMELLEELENQAAARDEDEQ